MEDFIQPPTLVEVELKRPLDNNTPGVGTTNEWWVKYEPQNRLITGRPYRILKRIEDLMITIGTLPLLLPILLICALLIRWESPGPILFKQQRTGKDGRRFGMYKFRTMVVNAEELKKDLAELNQYGELDGPLKLANDPRITRIGAILRRTSLDELPQIFNILKGEMSWIGPRPTSWGLASYELWHTERLDALPGITGLWQLCGRGTTDFDTWARWDITYVRRQSLMLDLQILLRTFINVLKQRGAH